MRAIIDTSFMLNISNEATKVQICRPLKHVDSICEIKGSIRCSGATHLSSIIPCMDHITQFLWVEMVDSEARELFCKPLYCLRVFCGFWCEQERSTFIFRNGDQTGFAIRCLKNFFRKSCGYGIHLSYIISILGNCSFLRSVYRVSKLARH